MKKLIFGLIAIVMLGFVGNAQDYKNSLNKFDEIGEIHNLLMNDLINKNLAKDLEISTVVAEIRKLIENNSTYRDAIGAENLDFDTNLIDNAIADYKNNYANLIKNSSLSSYSKKIVQEILDLTFNENTSYQSFISSIKKKENYIISSSIGSDEKENLLKTTSVARHSAYLWAVSKNLDGSNNATTAAKKMKGTVWIIIGADLLGAGLGGAAGAMYGSGCAYYITAGI